MSSPAKALTPRRWAFESRPFVELPPPFLCAMVLFPSQKLSQGLMPLNFSDVLTLELNAVHAGYLAA